MTYEYVWVELTEGEELACDIGGLQNHPVALRSDSSHPCELSNYPNRKV